ncbi:DUF3265 domain-containing protein, partial [Vibrio parahaemolyticus]|nr:DUF3265 domain-containing protein [Vibrio parahaemolyticus]
YALSLVVMVVCGYFCIALFTP